MKLALGRCREWVCLSVCLNKYMCVCDCVSWVSLLMSMCVFMCVSMCVCECPVVPWGSDRIQQQSTLNAHPKPQTWDKDQNDTSKKPLTSRYYSKDMSQRVDWPLTILDGALTNTWWFAVLLCRGQTSKTPDTTLGDARTVFITSPLSCSSSIWNKKLIAKTLTIPMMI